MGTLHRFRIFKTIVEKNGFCDAAEELLIAQPSVSAQLKSLEESLGVILIDRHQSKVQGQIVLTSAGEFVFEAACRILAEWDRVEKYARQYIERDAERDAKENLTLLTNSSIGSYLLPELVAEFTTTNPEFQISIVTEADCSTISKLIRKEAYDIAFMPKLSTTLKAVTEVASFPIAVLLVTARGNHPSRSPLPLPHVALLPLILPSANSLVGKAIRLHLASLDVHPANLVDANHPESVIKMLLKTKRYYALLSIVSVRDQLRTGLLDVVPTAPTLSPIQYVAFYPASKANSKPVKAFSEFFKRMVADGNHLAGLDQVANGSY